MSLFWIGIAVFILGIIVRNIFKFKYYHACKERAHTDIQRRELSAKYRPLIFAGLGLEVLGCVIGFVSIWVS